MVTKNGKPSFVMTNSADGEIKGSARCKEGNNVFNMLSAVNDKLIIDNRHYRHREFLIETIVKDIDSALHSKEIWRRTSARNIYINRRNIGTTKYVKSWWSSKEEKIKVYYYVIGKWVIFTHYKIGGFSKGDKKHHLIEIQVFYRERLYSISRLIDPENNRFDFYVKNTKFLDMCLTFVIASVDAKDVVNCSCYQEA